MLDIALVAFILYHRLLHFYTRYQVILSVIAVEWSRLRPKGLTIINLRGLSLTLSIRTSCTMYERIVAR